MHNNANENQEPTLLDDYTELFASYQNGNPQIEPDLIPVVTYIAREAIEMHIQWLGHLESNVPIAEYLETLKSHKDDVFLHLSVAAFLLNTHMSVRLQDAAEIKKITERAIDALEDIKHHSTSSNELDSQINKINNHRWGGSGNGQAYIN